jgi:epoxyqueuosine reductase
VAAAKTKQGIELKDALVAEARALGFDVVRITGADLGPDIAAGLDGYIAAGSHGDMDWMAREPERRRHPQGLWPRARSVIVLGVNYGPESDPLDMLAQRDRGAIASYALGKDYHDVVKKRLKALGRWLGDNSGLPLKVFVDTAPVMEKPLAQAAGLGWQGKHTNLVSREFGSWLFLGEIFTAADLPPDEAETDHCGNCNACQDVCPTAAFPAPYKLDARRCISYLTIEHKGPIPLEFRAAMGNRIYGCDDCQLVCPWNKFARAASHPDFKVRNHLDSAQLTELFAWTESDFDERMRGSAIYRIGYERWMRNIAVALGNAPSTTEVIQALRSGETHESPLIREHVQWALQQQMRRLA